MIPTAPAQLAELIEQMPFPAPKPDLFDLLEQQEGKRRATSLWMQATAWADAQARDAAIASLKACLQQEPPDLRQAFQHISFVHMLSSDKLSGLWLDLVNEIAAADDWGPLDLDVFLAEVEVVAALEPWS